MVGSRDVDFEGEEFARQVGETCARNRMIVVSGGARGVDRISMNASLESGGRTIGVLAADLMKASIERSARYAISEGQLLLISPYHPQAHFTVGTAMGRNKLIYAIADFALVVSTAHKKGGTWTGAEEELKREKSIAVFVRTGAGAPTGNKKLLDLGALEWPKAVDQEDICQQLSVLAGERPDPLETDTLNLFGSKPNQETRVGTRHGKETSTSSELIEDIAPKIQKTIPAGSIYKSVIPLILSHLEGPTTAEDLSLQLDIAKGQLNAWLKKAVEDGLVEKHNKPVRYSAKIYNDTGSRLSE